MNVVLYLLTSFDRLFFLLRSQVGFLRELLRRCRIAFGSEVVEDEGIYVTIEEELAPELRTIMTDSLMCAQGNVSERQLN